MRIGTPNGLIRRRRPCDSTSHRTASPRSSTSFDNPIAVLGDLIPHLDDPARQLVLWAPSVEDDALRSEPRLEARRRRVHLVAPGRASVPRRSGTYLAAYRRAFPALAAPASRGQSWVIGYYDASEALLTAIEHVGGDLSDGRSRLRRELARMRIQLPDGVVHLDANRQAVRDIPIVRFVAGAEGQEPSLEPVGTTHDVEQTYGGLLSSTPPPSKTSQPCRKATPPPWAR